MELYGKTDIGLIRNTNQDAFRFGSFEDGAIWMVVCDGMAEPMEGMLPVILR
ncbi:MAG: hypothetical protein ACLSB9_05145 [Hydrogeniiclostridium mannosilyticum]